MASIEISELSPAGTELISDFESYMEEISELELDSLEINGGASPWIATIVSIASLIIPGNTFPTV